jgi:mRNA interferase RelE/StbE
VTYTITIAPTALQMLQRITDRRVRASIRTRIDNLTQDPDKQGKPLTGPLAGYRSLRAVGQRYRIIYRIEHDQVVVLVVAIGLRREGSRQDIYALAQKLFRQRLLDPPPQ